MTARGRDAGPRGHSAASNEEIAEMLRDLTAVIGKASTRRAAQPFTQWDLDFFHNVRHAFKEKLESGFDLYPLSDKQIAQLQRIHALLAKTVVRTVQGA